MRSSDFVNHSFDYRPHWTPLGPTTTNRVNQRREASGKGRELRAFLRVLTYARFTCYFSDIRDSFVAVVSLFAFVFEIQIFLQVLLSLQIEPMMDETPDEYIARREGKDVVPYLSHTCMSTYTISSSGT